MRRRIEIAFWGLMLLTLLAGDHFQGSRGFSADEFFQKYKAKHEAVKSQLQAVGESLRGILRAREKTPAPRLYIALLTELARIKAEQGLVDQWEQGTLKKEDSIALMADSMLILEYLQMMGAYAESLNRAMKRPSPEVRQIASSEALLEQAATEFPEVYDSLKAGISAFEDPEVLALSASAPKLVPIAKALVTTEGKPQDLVSYRVRFFAQYADNIIQKNRKMLEGFQQALKKS